MFKILDGLRGRKPAAVSEPEPLVLEDYKPDVDPHDLFWKTVAASPPRRVIDVGTLQAVPGVSTTWKRHFPAVPDEDYVRVDIQAGPDVDVVADLHALPAEWTGRFDCFIAHAVYEHLERPWIAARETARILEPGGVFTISTHQTFPLHGYPQDFFRFSKEALRLILEDAGLVVEACDYRHRCAIVPPQQVVHEFHLAQWNRTFPSFIIVEAFGRKPG